MSQSRDQIYPLKNPKTMRKIKFVQTKKGENSTAYGKFKQNFFLLILLITNIFQEHSCANFIKN